MLGHKKAVILLMVFNSSFVSQAFKSTSYFLVFGFREIRLKVNGQMELISQANLVINYENPTVGSKLVDHKTPTEDFITVS